LQTRGQTRDPIVDPMKELTQAEYDVELASLPPQRLQYLTEDFGDNPGVVEGFNRFRFANKPNVPDFDTLTAYSSVSPPSSHSLISPSANSKIDST